MYLLHTTTYELKYFHSAKQAPPYAILSHVWNEGEVLFQDMRNIGHAKIKQGWDKIASTCRQALNDNLDWAWVDTCCIDKSSSAELSEAINSMFHWYRLSAVCYVFLADLQSNVSLRDDMPLIGSINDAIDLDAHDETDDAIGFDALDGTEHPRCEVDVRRSGSTAVQDFSNCKWWTRGWTLQELLAPLHTHFFNGQWDHIARLIDMVTMVSRITSIDRFVLWQATPLSKISIATRMSWAATRETTREEDHAYCMLGIFEINMPLLYGEGPRAFTRLQEEIIKVTTDLSLFAWPAFTGKGPSDQLFASSPAAFQGLHSISLPSTPDSRCHHRCDLTNAGLFVRLPVLSVKELFSSLLGTEGRMRPLLGSPLPTSFSPNCLFADLGCGYSKNFGSSPELGLGRIMLILTMDDTYASDETVCRVHSNRVTLIEAYGADKAKPRDVVITRDRPIFTDRHSLSLKTVSFTLHRACQFEVLGAFPRPFWDLNTMTMSASLYYGGDEGIKVVRGGLLIRMDEGEVGPLSFDFSVDQWGRPDSGCSWTYRDKTSYADSVEPFGFGGSALAFRLHQYCRHISDFHMIQIMVTITTESTRNNGRKIQTIKVSFSQKAVEPEPISPTSISALGHQHRAPLPCLFVGG